MVELATTEGCAVESHVDTGQHVRRLSIVLGRCCADRNNYRGSVDYNAHGKSLVNCDGRSLTAVTRTVLSSSEIPSVGLVVRIASLFAFQRRRVIQNDLYLPEEDWLHQLPAVHSVKNERQRVERHLIDASFLVDAGRVEILDDIADTNTDFVEVHRGG